MRKVIIGALLAVGAAGTANAATLFTSDFQDGGFGGFTATGQVQNANSTTYGPCCGATGDPANRFISFGSGTRASGTLSRDFATVLGREYTLTFDYGALGRGFDPITVSYAGQLASFSRTANNDLAQTFTQGVFKFTGTGGVDTLQFVSTGARNGDGVIDNVSVSGVPEASTWAMMIFGVGAVGGTMRRRNRTSRLAHA